MKKFILLFVFIFILSNIPVTFARDLPSEFWGYNNLYSDAVERKDNYKIIEYASRLIEIIKNEPETDQINEIMGSRLDQMGLAYERLGDYANAGKCYRQYIPYAQKKGWSDGVKIANAKVLQYTPDIEVFTAKEKVNDKVLFGTNFDGETRKSLTNESLILVYIEFGDSDFTWLKQTLEQAKRKGAAVEVALNLPNEGEQLATVPLSEKYIVSLLNVIAKYDVKVFLRFGAEMNIWTKVGKPQEFINAFKFVSNLSKIHTKNVKMVWSVNQVSTWHIDMNDYYPGDEYVDYVGVSAYLQKYFLGRNDWSEFDRFNEVVFLTGESADPVKALNEVVTRYGRRKPIIISEGGASHYIRSLNEDATSWALLNLKKQYWYLPMVYPQIKAMAYFDRSMPSEVNEYSLSKNAALAKEYKELTALPHFNGNVSWQNLGNTLEIEQKQQDIYSYIHIYNHSVIKADYYVDGVWAASASEIPYKASIDFSKYGLGAHSLKVFATENGVALFERTYNINVIDRAITVNVNGKRILFDTDPILKNDRTLVPMRAIFEALGATVNWKAEDQTITSSVKGVTIKMQIGNKKMTKNGKEIALDVPPEIYGDRTLVPVRAVSEAMSAKVEWNEKTRTVEVNK